MRSAVKTPGWTGLPPPLERARILERIAGAAARPIALLVAPAGYGKSTALSQYLATLREPYVRYDVHPDQNDLLAFLRGFADALRSIAPDARVTLPGAYESNGRSATPGGDLATWMHAHLRDYNGTIAIDDLHAGDAQPEIARFCSSLVERTMPSIRWILVSRTVSELPIGAWVAYGHADLPIDEAELRFTADELRSAGDAAGITVDDAELDAMMQLTGGWPTALGFALRSSARSSDLERIAAMTREMAYSYFADQVYRTLDYEERALLEAAALLNEVDADVLVAAGFDRAGGMLEDLRRRVAFLVEDRPGIYRCHDLFRRFVRHRTVHRGARAARDLRAVLASALERRGRIAEALRMNVAGERRDRVLSLIEDHGLDLLGKGHRDAILEALASLDQSTRRDRPVVVALRAIIAEGAGDFDEAERLLECALSCPLPAQVQPAMVLRLARLRVNRFRDVGPYVCELAESGARAVDRCDAIAMLAAAAARAQDRAGARLLLERSTSACFRIDDDEARAGILQRNGIAYLEIGDVEDAARALTEAERLASALGLWSIVTRASLGLSHIALFVDADTLRALHLAEQAATAAARAGEPRSMEIAAASILSIHVVRGTSFGEKFESDFPAMATESTRLYLAWANAQRAAWNGRFREAHEMLREVIRYQVIPADRAVGYATYALCLAMDGSARLASDAARSARDAIDASATSEIGSIFFDFADLFLALATVSSSKFSGSHRPVLRRSKDPSILAAFEVTAMLVRSKRLGTVLGTTFTEKLAALSRAGFGGYANLFRATADNFESATQKAKMTLTATECRVFGLLAEGCAPKDVAVELDRSVLTVRTHIQNVIAKFECHGQAEAIALAQRHQLI